MTFLGKDHLNRIGILLVHLASVGFDEDFIVWLLLILLNWVRFLEFSSAHFLFNSL